MKSPSSMDTLGFHHHRHHHPWICSLSIIHGYFHSPPTTISTHLPMDVVTHNNTNTRNNYNHHYPLPCFFCAFHDRLACFARSTFYMGESADGVFCQATGIVRRLVHRGHPARASAWHAGGACITMVQHISYDIFMSYWACRRCVYS